ncbi:hypothetical protein [Pseudomonas aeruginosa]|uniref:hypothetical protein n=1 Tax=Pseudomonas aeruginosa TaxID=287 RepID=UPI0013CDE35D|nr:hypothetical protein [Pseudomonas aeruginosa]
MRIFTTAQPSDVKTVKAQGRRIAEAWYQSRGLTVEVKAIKRTESIGTDRQCGFIVLESLFNTYLCHYQFEADRLEVTPEQQLSAVHRRYLKCPEALLSQSAPENPFWRLCVAKYAAATKELTREQLTGNAVLFLTIRYETREYGEPFYILQKDENQWFGIDCYGERKPLSLGLDDIHDHCPSLIDVDSLKPMDTSELSPDCVVAGGLIYKEVGESAIVLGRPKTRAEIIADSFAFMLAPTFELHGESIWA